LFSASVKSVTSYKETTMNIDTTANAASPIRIAVIDDHPMFREGTVKVLTGADGIEVVGDGATANDALEIARECVPDVMLLDLNLPGGGIEAAASIARTYPKVRTIVLTASEDEQDVTSALQAGARGYILKGSCGHEVIEIVRAIVRGDSYVAPNLAARLLVRKGQQVKAVVNDSPGDFTSRETEIFQLVSRGLSNKEVARSLKCTERTVKHHMTNIMQKLNVRNRVQAVLKFRGASASA
jgi:two-component system, NarL family, nitrate/nitrite response regulator NarL